MAKRAQKEFQMNRPIFLTMIVLAIATIGLTGYDFAIGENPFDGRTSSVLSATDVPTVTPYLTPTNTP